MRKIQNNQAGFTLIELVVVIVILGILAATALPKFVDMSEEAEKAAAQGVAGAVSSAGSMNYAKYKAAGGTSTGAVAISDGTDACAGAANSVHANSATLMTGSVSLVTVAATSANEFQIEGGATKVCSAGATIECTIKSKSGEVATAYVPCTN